MLIFTVFTLGYFAGVFTALLVFPPNVKEIEEQEINAAAPLIRIEKEKEFNTKVEDESISRHPAIYSP